MKKIWSHLAVGFAFFSAGLMVAIKWLVPEKTVIKGKIRLNQRGRGNTQLTDIRPQIDANTKREQRKNRKQAKKDLKKLKNGGA